MIDAYICDFIRTPFGRYAGVLSSVRADDLASHPLRMLIARYPHLDLEAIDDVILGCANQAGEDNRNLARIAMTAVNALETRGGRRAIATMCIGIGQGIAMLIENFDVIHCRYGCPCEW
jgi:acetyl-CoA acetyltransferase